MKKSFIFVFLLSFASSLYATEYLWLERLLYPNTSYYTQPTPKLQAWLDERDVEKEDYINSLSEAVVESDIEDYWAEKREIKSVQVDQNIKIVLSLKEDASGHIIEVDNQGLRSTLIDTTDYNTFHNLGLFQSYVLTDITLSPGKNFLIVKAPTNAKTTYTNAFIFDLKNLQTNVRELENVNIEAFEWDSDHSFYYRHGITYNIELKYDILKDFHQYIPTYRPDTFRPIKGSEFLFASEYDRDDQGNITKQFIKVKHFNSADSESVDITSIVSGIEMKYGLRSVSFNDSAFIFSSEYRNHENFIFVPYSFKESKLTLGLPVKKSFPKNGSIQKVIPVGSNFLAIYLSGPNKTYYILDAQGNELKKLDAPMAGLRSIKLVENTTYEMSFRSEVVSKKTLEIDLNNWDKDFIDRELYTDDEGNEFVAKYINAKSKDGTVVPVKVVHLKDVEPSKESPVHMLAYGGHGLVSYIIPGYRAGLHSFLKNEGVYATPIVRGGGEYGNDWYTPVFGTLVRYEDTEAAIRKLHELGIGSRETTGFEGWSSGGLLAGVMLTRNPELFKLVIPGNGLHDQERFQVLQDPFAWTDDYGDYRSAQSAAFIRSYSPVYNAKIEREYPVVYSMVGDNDIRVNPSQTYKLTGVLQDFQIGTNPIIMDRYPTAGHWITSPNYTHSTAIKALKRKWRVIFNELGL